MTSTQLQTIMQSRPNDKKKLSARWEGFDATTKQAGTMLFDALKAMAGKINIEPTPAQQKITGMNALLSTGWDWRRAAPSKSKQRDYHPVAEALMLELEYVDTYREELLEDPDIAALRQKLEEAIASCERTTQMALVAAENTSGGKVMKTGSRKRSVYWDGLQVAAKTPGEQVDGTRSKKQLMRIKKQQGMEQRDREEITKIVQQLTQTDMAKLSKSTESAVAMEVAIAVNALIEVSVLPRTVREPFAALTDHSQVRDIL